MPLLPFKQGHRFVGVARFNNAETGMRHDVRRQHGDQIIVVHNQNKRPLRSVWLHLQDECAH